MASVRPLGRRRAAALPLLARGAALRFLLTRLYDWLQRPAGALVKRKDPQEYLRKLRFHRGAASRARLRLWPSEAARMTPEPVIFTDGACSGNPGPGGWGAILRIGDDREGTVGRRSRNHQQPHGADGGHHGAGGAEAALHGRSATPTATMCVDGITKWIHGWKKNGWRTADKKPVKNVELWQRLDAARAPAQGALALGEGPWRPCRKRARRSAGKGWRGDGAAEAEVARSRRRWFRALMSSAVFAADPG